MSGLVFTNAIYEWVEYPEECPVFERTTDDGEKVAMPDQTWDPRCIGFRAKVKATITGGELRALETAHKASRRINATEDDVMAFYAMIAPRVKQWEFFLVSDDGTKVEVDPPSIGGPERFEELPIAALWWLLGQVRTAYLPKAITRSGKKSGTTDSTTQTEATPETELPPS